MALQLDALNAAVTAEIAADQAAILLIQGIADQISEAVAAAALDPAAQAHIDQLTAQLHASAALLGAAVVANTPVADPAPVEPGPTA